MAGHVHRDRQGRSPAPAMSHRPVGKKRVHHAVSDRSPKRTEALEVPRLRALEAHAAAIPISSSAASSTSPRSGSSRVNPYPVGEAIESSPFELVPSVATQATQSWEQGGSLELTPIRDDTSPTTPSNKPTQCNTVWLRANCQRRRSMTSIYCPLRRGEDCLLQRASSRGSLGGVALALDVVLCVCALLQPLTCPWPHCITLATYTDPWFHNRIENTRSHPMLLEAASPEILSLQKMRLGKGFSFSLTTPPPRPHPHKAPDPPP